MGNEILLAKEVKWSKKVFYKCFKEKKKSDPQEKKDQGINEKRRA